MLLRGPLYGSGRSVSRSADISRETSETAVSVRVDVDGTGQAHVSTGVGFLDHMLTLFARHSRFDLSVEARGDIHVDDHHTTEDIGIALGLALHEALGDKRGVARYGHAYVPMDESLLRVALDLSGRPFCVYEVPIAGTKVGSFDTELVEHFCRSLAFNGLFTLHVDLIRGSNSHHILEAVFKALALSLHAATRIVREDLPSTKGTL
jgi:imidazoleglycerol-phosphate dehydratase